MAANNVSREDLERIFEQYRKEVNASLPAFMNVARFEIHPEEFVKPRRGA